MGASSSFLTAEDVPPPRGERRRLVIFDFDQTLATVGVNACSPQGVQALGGHERVRALDAMMSTIRALGVDCGIVSFNSRSVIVKCLNAAKLLRHFRSRDTYGREQYQGKLEKSTLIHGRILKPRGIRPQDTLFVDDDLHNIRDLRVNKHTSGCVLHHVKSGHGIDAKDMDAIVQWCEGKRPRKPAVGRDAVSWRAPPEVVAA